MEQFNESHRNPELVYSEFYDGQGLGNQLWSYAVVRSLANRIGSDFSLLSSNRFKGKDFLKLDYGRFGDCSLASSPSRLTLHHSDVIYFEKKKKHRRYGFDLTEKNAIPTKFENQLKIEGNFENEEYINDFANEIRAMYKVADGYSYTLGNNDCVISFRGRDFYAHQNLGLNIKYFHDAMKLVLRLTGAQVNFKLVTDDTNLTRKLFPDLETISIYGNFDSSFPHRKVASDLSTLQRAKYLIISNSSFSWWGAWTNEVSELVVAPKYWARHNLNSGYWSPSGIITNSRYYLDAQGKTWSSSDCKKEFGTLYNKFRRRINGQPWHNWWR